MRDEDKPFILYRSGRWSFRIVPRGAAGWVRTLVWLALIVPPTALLVMFANGEPQGARLHAGLALYLLANLVWGVGGVMWMRARAEVVDVEELLELKRERERKARGLR